MTGVHVQAETPAVAAQEAGERRSEVYMGIDVYGRGTYAGGQMNSHVAAAAALREGVFLPACEGSCTAEAPSEPFSLGIYNAASLGLCQYANALSGRFFSMPGSIGLLTQSYRWQLMLTKGCESAW